jgi:tRNA(Ile)-lysidine synthase
LQDVFVDRKVPRDERDRVPVVVDARGRLVWVAGVALADECRVTAPEAGVVILRLRAKE